MAKEKEAQVVCEIEVEPIEEIQAEVNEATDNKEVKMKKKIFTKDNMKKLGKDALKVLGGIGVGVIGTFAIAMKLKEGECVEEQIEIQALESGEPIEINIEV